MIRRIHMICTKVHRMRGDAGASDPILLVLQLCRTSYIRMMSLYNNHLAAVSRTTPLPAGGGLNKLRETPLDQTND